MLVSEAAKELGVTAGRVRELIRVGTLHARHLDNGLLDVDPHSVEQYANVRQPKGENLIVLNQRRREAAARRVKATAA